MKTFLCLILVVSAISFTSCARRAVVTTSTVTVVKTLPKHYKLVKVQGKRYYFWNGRHYKKTRRGYMLVRI